MVDDCLWIVHDDAYAHKLRNIDRDLKSASRMMATLSLYLAYFTRNNTIQMHSFYLRF